MHDVIIIGGGPAGLTAAIYCLRAGRTALVIEQNGFGGQIALSPKVENIPGTLQTGGAEFADRLVEQVMALGADLELETVLTVEKEDGLFRVATGEGGIYQSRALILAVGVRHRTLGLEGEEALIGRGLSFCAVCDGAFYAGQDVAVIGGGNSALQEALLLSETCRRVTVVQDLPHLTGERRLADALAARDNMEILFGATVTGYLADESGLTGLRLRSGATGEERELAVAGAFLAVGLIPENGPFAHLADLDEGGYFAAGEDCLTKTAGVFVAGDCRRKSLRQVTTAAADGAVAARRAEEYLLEGSAGCNI